jgi:hypothetical protein
MVKANCANWSIFNERQQVRDFERSGYNRLAREGQRIALTVSLVESVAEKYIGLQLGFIFAITRIECKTGKNIIEIRGLNEIR